MGPLSELLGRRIYLDTNVFIYALNGFPEFAVFLKGLFDAMDDGRVQSITSELTVAELLVIPFRHGDAAEEARCRMILHPRPGLELFPITRGLLEDTARIRASNPALRTPDALHLATARLAGCDVFLTNDHRLEASAPPQIVLLAGAQIGNP